MNWHGVEIWRFLAGLGLFLLGMYMLEQGLRGLSSKTVKRLLRNQTLSPLRGVFAGTAATAILQSSSLVGLIVLAFVGAGILDLRNALGIVLGSNLGTTLKGWIVATLGFKLDLVQFAQPMLALGALGTVFLREGGRQFYYSNVLLGLGLLLMGLGEMTGGFDSLAANVDVSGFRGHSILFYFFGGALFTALVQSSSASMMILLSALYSGVLTLSEAAPLAIGADLGTTSTVLLGSLHGSGEKRRVALSHFFFNLVTDLLALLMLPVMLWFIASVLAISDPLFALVAFHSLFNVLGIALFLPVLGRFVRFLEWLIPPARREGKNACVHIARVPPEVTDAAIEAIRLELLELILLAVRLNAHCFKLRRTDIFPAGLDVEAGRHGAYEDDYAILKRATGETLGYAYAVQSGKIDEDDVRELTQLNHAVRNASYAAKFIKDIRHNLMEFRSAGPDAVATSVDNFHARVGIIYRKLVALLMNRNPELADDHYLELKKALRSEYELFIRDVYAFAGDDRVDDEEISSMLNANRAFYLSTSALLESARIYLHIAENPATAPAPIVPDA